MRFESVRRMLTTAALLLATTAGTLPLCGTTLARMNLSQMARAADTVVRARCVGSSSRWENGSIWTLSEFELVERFQGSPPSRIRIRLPGGRVGGISTHVEDVPQFRAGEEAVLFLEARTDGSYGVTAWAEGTFRIRKSAASGQELVTQDSSGLAVFDPATRQFRSEGVRNLPWSEFRQRLANAMSDLPRGLQAQPGLFPRGLQVQPGLFPRGLQVQPAPAPQSGASR